MTYHAKVINGGKIVIPADLRREFGIKDGDTLVVERELGGGLSIKTFDQVVSETQREARAIFGPDYTVDQFLRESRADWGEVAWPSSSMPRRLWRLCWTSAAVMSSQVSSRVA